MVIRRFRATSQKSARLPIDGSYDDETLPHLKKSLALPIVTSRLRFNNRHSRVFERLYAQMMWSVLMIFRHWLQNVTLKHESEDDLVKLQILIRLFFIKAVLSSYICTIPLRWIWHYESSAYVHIYIIKYRGCSRSQSTDDRSYKFAPRPRHKRHVEKERSFTLVLLLLLLNILKKIRVFFFIPSKSP